MSKISPVIKNSFTKKISTNMKTRFTFITVFLFTISLISCEKMEFRKDISGTWYLRYAGGGFTQLRWKLILRSYAWNETTSISYLTMTH
jgi:hypothetical protein